MILLPILTLRKSRNSTPALRYAFIYICFLLVCLTLGLFFYVSASDNARSAYWAHHAAQLNVDVSTTDGNLAAMENYARQLSTDSTFVRLTNMTGLESPQFVYTAYEAMKNLSLRQYGLANLPATAHIYLPLSEYIISSSQFSTADQFYRFYLAYPHGMKTQWMDLFRQRRSAVASVNMAPFTGRTSDIILIYDIGSMLNAHVPAVVWFDLDTTSIAKRFFSAAGPEGALLISSPDGERLFSLAQGGGTADDSLLSAMEQTAFGSGSIAACGDHMLIRTAGNNGWIYTLALPQALCTQALGDYTPAFICVFLLAIVFGAILVIFLVRQSMRPLHDMNRLLVSAQGENAQMQREMDAQRPALCMSYLKTLVSGHVSSNEEFAYMMRYLRLDGALTHFVLFCGVHPQSPAPADDGEIYRIVLENLNRHLTDAHPLYHYTTLARQYIVLVSYDADAAEPLEDLSRRITALHDALEKESLWFYAGVGGPCTQPQLLWEAYEQARAAARYTTKGRIFLPYSSIPKDPDTWYYPVEISAKLLHFITTGNRQQVSEMFALIHRENFIERSLPVALMGYLLSDLKNTLIKARYQIEMTPDEALAAQITLLDRRLAEAAAFPELEAGALALCSFFTSAVEPSDPIPEVQRYLQQNFSDPSLSLSKLSGLFNISESYLSHLFKDRTGENFSVYLENLRMNEAIARMRAPGCNLSTLYQELGYSNAATWRRAFKKRFGITPSEMLRQNE